MLGYFPYSKDRYDVYVDANSGKCLPYPCPFAIKIFFSDSETSSYNGYYVINPPATFLGKNSNIENTPAKISFQW